MSQIIYFKDVIEGKDYNELMKLLPCKVCHEYTWGHGRISRSSYDVIGFGPDYVILGDYTYGYDEDAFFGDGRYTIDTYKLVKFEDLKEEYIFAHEPTEKQIEWLKKNGKYDSSITGYEAWHIINDAIEASKKAKEEREKRKREREAEEYADWDDDPYWDCYDVPNH